MWFISFFKSNAPFEKGEEKEIIPIVAAGIFVPVALETHISLPGFVQSENHNLTQALWGAPAF